MSEFRYTAVDRSGKRYEGIYEANSKNELMNMIRHRSLYPVKIEELAGGKSISFTSIFKNVKIKDIAIFCRQFYVMINAGVSIIKCLDILSKETENKKLRSVLNEAYEDVQKGLTLSEALKNHRKIFPDLLIQMVEVGEISGTLDTIMARMATHYEKENKIKKKIQSAMIYPVLLSVVSFGIIIFLLTFVMPIFIGMFTSSGVALPLPTRLLIRISELLKNYWYFIITTFVLGLYFIKKCLSTDGGRTFADNLKMKIPVVRTTTRKIITLRFCRTMSMLLSSGIPLIQALEVVTKIVQNKKVEKGLLQAKEEVKKGIELAEPIKKIGVFPPMVVSMIKIGEQSGSLDEILNKTADFYDEEVEMSLEKMVKLLEPILIVVMAVVVGSIVFAMVLPMFDMFSTLRT